MAARIERRGEVTGLDAKEQPVIIRVFRRRGSTYLSHDGHEHLVHPSNLRRANGFALEAILVYHVTDAVYHAY
jgi:hypothetical protein